MSQNRPTEKQLDAYAKAFLKTGDKTNAWRVAFPNSKAGMQTQWTKACAFHKLGQVQNRISKFQDRFREKEDKEFDLSVSDIKKRLAYIYQKGVEADKKSGKPHNLSAAASVMNEFNRMAGNHAPANHTISGLKGGAPINFNKVTPELLDDLEKDLGDAFE